VLKKLFFKPVVNSIQRRKKAFEKLAKKIASQEDVLLTLEKEKHNRLKKFQTQVKSQIEELKQREPKRELHEVEYKEIDKSAYKKLQAKISALLIKKAPHGY